jgi:hypothetical protein
MQRIQRFATLQTTLAQLAARDRLAPLVHIHRLVAQRLVERLAQRVQPAVIALVMARKRFAKLATFRQLVHRALVP